MSVGENGFHLPENISFEEETLSDTYGKLIAEPLERGFGITIGNALRRVLLSSIKGAAVTSIIIDGVSHEFSTIKGVKEDVVEIILNVKKIRFKMHGDEPVTASIEVRNGGVVSAADIHADSRIEVLNPDTHIAMLDSGASFKAQLTVEKGRGYVPSEEIKDEDAPIGTIAVDAIFTPIKKVIFDVEKTRVGKSTDYDKLILDIWTDGSVTPKEAVQKATRTLMQHMKLFLMGEDKEEESEEESQEEELPEVSPKDEPVEQVQEVLEEAEPRGFNRNLMKTVDELELSVRSQNCLKNADIKYLYQLVDKSEHDMLKMKNFGRKSLNEIREILTTLGLDFNMRIDMEAVKRELAIKEGGG